ncbi:MAG: hypothetical protein R3F34_05390 [Planctomycetota bacterium]
MGFFWDLLQQSQISDQHDRSSSLERRVEDLEQRLHATNQLLRRVVERLEERFGDDVDGDGRVGR